MDYEIALRYGPHVEAEETCFRFEGWGIVLRRRVPGVGEPVKR